MIIWIRFRSDQREAARNHITSTKLHADKDPIRCQGRLDGKLDALSCKIASSVKYQMSKVLLIIFLRLLGIPESQNYLNYQQQQQQQPQNQPQGRFLSSFQQNSRNGFFPVQRSQPSQGGSFQQQDLFNDGPSSPSSFYPFQSFAVSVRTTLMDI